MEWRASESICEENCDYQQRIQHLYDPGCHLHSILCIVNAKEDEGDRYIHVGEDRIIEELTSDVAMLSSDLVGHVQLYL
jgi:hypothetical protein